VDAPSTVTLTIDGREVTARPGSMIIQVADDVGVYIPRFCYHPKLSIAANCRMCLVEVEKAPKPLPACATPVSEGMVVRTRSTIAVEAQQGTMEFLLINHPLDCPVCDQGGECPLQDQAMGYGQDYSRFEEQKRVKDALDLGPLVATAMTRCIHCTRCVRFGREVAGTMELGATGRGEDMTVETYLGGSVDSEVSGNIIDLCPVGALTSKPYRFSARPWELMSHAAISPHDSLGSNLNLQTVQRNLKRVVPRDNEQVNSCWISDRDRFSYEGAESPDRLLYPMVRTGAGLQEVSWEQALKAAAEAMRMAEGDAHGLVALIHPMSSMEEMFLLQKLVRGMGSSDIDHRLWQRDFSDDHCSPMYPGFETPVADIPALSSLLLIGANPRKEIPLLGLRIREMTEAGGCVGVLGQRAVDANFRVDHELVLKPKDLAGGLYQLVCSFEGGRERIPAALRHLESDLISPDRLAGLRATLSEGGGAKAVLLGEQALSHRHGAHLRILGSILSELTQASFGTLVPCNGAGAWWTGAVPHRVAGGERSATPGFNASSMLGASPKTVVLYGLEPATDHHDPKGLDELMSRAGHVLCFSAFRSGVPEQATVVLPVAPFSESAGSFMNLNGRVQFSRPALEPKGEARPGWKVLRVLGNFLSLPGFDYQDVGEVLATLSPPPPPRARFDVSDSLEVGDALTNSATETDRYGFSCVHFLPLYSGDPIVRRAQALSKTLDAERARACEMNPVDMAALGCGDGDLIQITDGDRTNRLAVRADPAVLKGCIGIPLGQFSTSRFGSASVVSVKRASTDG
jgi:NADH-quinone oxidoreductase subunit G